MSEFEYAHTALSPAARHAVIEGLASTSYDLIVIGMGVTGAGVALDAALRGLKVLIVDKHDIAFGTSRWSSKLAHGGLRYLASGNVGIAQRSAKERGTLMTVTAPHLTRALPQVVPVMKKFSLANRILPRVGFLAGDGLRIAAGTPSSVLPPSRTVSAERVAKLCPAVDTDSVQFGYVNYDGQLIDDARLVTALVRTAAGYGADVLTHAHVDSVNSATGDVRLLIEEGPAGNTGNSAGSCVKEVKEVELQVPAIVNATGVWAGSLCEQVQVTPSRGTHLVIDAAKVGNPTGALTVPVPGATNRFCFILPVQMGRCYVGLTDKEAPVIEDVPTAPEEDMDWILDVVNQALETALTPHDVIGQFAGLRPLVTLKQASAAGGARAEVSTSPDSAPEPNTSSSSATADLSREHLVLTEGKMVTVTGGKLTEYRLMAEETVDTVIDQILSKRSSTTTTLHPCTTASTPLVGAFPPVRAGVVGALVASGSWDINNAPASQPAHSELRKALIARFGEEAPFVIASSKLERPWEPVAPNVQVTRAEFSFAVTHEGARTVEDILDRRTRIGMVPEQRAASVAAAEEALRVCLN